MKRFLLCICTIAFMLSGLAPAGAAPYKKLDKAPVTERWFGIYIDNERVGFYRQIIAETSDGYRMEGDGSVRLKVMGFTKEATTRESYLVGKTLALRSFDVEQSINGVTTRVSGKASDSSIRLKSEINGKTSEKLLKYKGDVFPGPALNLYPLLRDPSPGKIYRILTFDPEEIKVKEIKISVLGEEKSPDGQMALKLRNNLYPFVNNDIWVDSQGNTLVESVREGLVTTRAEDPKVLAATVGNMALAKKDLIYDFSMVRAEPPIRDPKKLTGMVAEIVGWNGSLPLVQGGGQLLATNPAGSLVVRTGSALPAPAQIPAPAPAAPAPAAPPQTGADAADYLKPAEKIEADAPEIVAKAKELAAGKQGPLEIVRTLAAWTADWLSDTVEDTGSATASFKSRTGNCQTHARLYTALARAAGIPTRFVSGLVYQDGKGFLYHSWAESLISGSWQSVDPTYNQVPADPTHIKLFEGHTPSDMAPLVAIIGRIKIKILETKY